MSTTTIRPPARASIGRGSPAAYRAMVAFDQAIDLDPALRELVKIRASVVNGCAFCIDLHTRDALAAGESPQRLYALAACCCLPSFEEGFGLPVIEAMARGLPVACSGVGALAELAADAALRDELAARGRARAAEFSWRASARAHLEAYTLASRS